MVIFPVSHFSKELAVPEVSPKHTVNARSAEVLLESKDLGLANPQAFRINILTG